MIKNEYMEEIINVSNKQQIINKGLINRIALSLIEQSDPLTKSIFQEFYFAQNLWNDPTVYASCDREEGVINYCYEHSLGYAMAMMKDNYSHLVCNLEIIGFLIHEIEHLKESYKQQQNELENKLISNCSYNFISELVIDKYLSNILKKYQDNKIINNYIFNKYKKFYTNILDVCPDEKIAEADSHKIIVDSVQTYPNFENINKQDYENIIILYMASLLTGYKKNNYTKKYTIPLQKFIDEISKIDIHKKLDLTIKDEIDKASKYTSEQKMKYGLPITNEDVVKVKRKYLPKSTI